VRRRGARGVKLRADGVAGVIQITLPARGGIAEALALLAGHGDWLAAQVAAWPAPLPLLPGAAIPFDGGVLQLDWAPGRPRAPQRHGDRLQLGGPLETVAARTLRWLKAEALSDLEPATRRLAADVARPVAQVRVGDPKSRWGSCARGSRIAYSWRLILAPPLVRRHVVAHEVAHLVHANHGAGFHALLDSLDPNRRAAQQWLKTQGRALHWVGRAPIP